MGVSTIEWTQRTWNPVSGCSVVSPGCHHCYARTMAGRFSAPGAPYHGLAVMTEHGPQWTGDVQMSVKHLDDPLRWRKPQLVFVNSMSDLFHEGLTNEEVAAVFGVMAAARQHTFQVLTKRAKRMREWFKWVDDGVVSPDQVVSTCAANYVDVDQLVWPWPLPNVWLGVSVEDQQRADERIPYLLETPAAVRFLSCEPLLGPVDLSAWLFCDDCRTGYYGRGSVEDTLTAAAGGRPWRECRCSRLSWVIVGSESGPAARTMAIEWARDVVDQCLNAGVPVFVKQLANAKDRKGGNPEHWPEGVWPRQWPAAALPVATPRKRAAR